ALERAKRVQNRMVLGAGGENPSRAGCSVRESLECEIVRLGGGRGEKNLLRPDAEEPGDGIARGLEPGAGGPSARARGGRDRGGAIEPRLHGRGDAGMKR